MTSEVLQMALEYMERHAVIDGIPVRDALRKELAQPAQPEQCLDCGSNNIGTPANYDSLIDSVKIPEQVLDMVDWEAVASDQAMTIAMMQCEQEPVATKNKNGLTLHAGWDDLPDDTKLYTSPPQRKPLTDAEIDQLVVSEVGLDADADLMSEFARAIELHHGIGDKT